MKISINVLSSIKVTDMCVRIRILKTYTTFTYIREVKQADMYGYVYV
jgi:hypothetical protein